MAKLYNSAALKRASKITQEIYDTVWHTYLIFKENTENIKLRPTVL